MGLKQIFHPSSLFLQTTPGRILLIPSPITPLLSSLCLQCWIGEASRGVLPSSVHPYKPTLLVEGVSDGRLVSYDAMFNGTYFTCYLSLPHFIMPTSVCPVTRPLDRSIPPGPCLYWPVGVVD